MPESSSPRSGYPALLRSATWQAMGREPEPGKSEGPEAVRRELVAQIVGTFPRSPLLLVDEARYLLSEAAPQTVVRFIDDGQLRAVNIAGGARRRELRIYRASAEALLLKGVVPDWAPESILPPDRSSLRQDEVACLLRCTLRHVRNLPEMSGAKVDLATLREFLKRREVLAAA